MIEITEEAEDMAEDKKSYSAADLQRKVQAGEDPSVEEPEDVTEGSDGDGQKPDAEGTEEDTVDEQDQSSEETSEGSDQSDAKSEKKEKKKKSNKKKDPRDEKIEELNDKLLRNLAEFENFRNRSEKEKEARFDMGAKSVIEKILPVVDNLERGFDGLSDEEKETPFVKGIEAVYKQIQTAFEEMGVTPIESVGQPFDPNIHNAVMHDEDDSDQENIVVEEFQKGYLYKDSVVRHSMVKVLN